MTTTGILSAFSPEDFLTPLSRLANTLGSRKRSPSTMISAKRHKNIGSFLEDALLQYKTEIALVEWNRNRETTRLTYAEVRARASRLAASLDRLGVPPDARVAILMSNQSRWLIGASAVLMRGGTLVPLDYKLSPAEQASLLAHSGATVALTEGALLGPVRTAYRTLTNGPVEAGGGRVTWIGSELPGDASIESFDGLIDPVALPGTPAFARARRERSDVAAIVYSSGTGGAPKGCMLPHGAYLSQYEALTAQYPMTTGDRYFSILPTNHAIDFMCGFLGPFGGGATVVHQRVLRPEFLTNTMREMRITHMAVVPLLLESFERSIRMKLEGLPEWKQRAFESAKRVNVALTDVRPNTAISRALLPAIHSAFGSELRLLFCGGAFLDPKRAKFFYDLGIPVVIGYGLTECCTVATVNDLSPFRPDTVGRAVAGVEIRIASPDEHGVGEVQLRGPTLMCGYLNDANQTAASFDGDWLRTGDLGQLDGAEHLKLVGRAKDMIVTAGGKNIYPQDVESTFCDAGAEEHVVFARNYLFAARGGHRLVDEQLVLVVRPRQLSTDEEVDALFAKLREQNATLPDHKRVHQVLVTWQTFPRTASMKIKREQLRDDLHSARTPKELRPLFDARTPPTTTAR